MLLAELVAVSPWTLCFVGSDAKQGAGWLSAECPLKKGGVLAEGALVRQRQQEDRYLHNTALGTSVSGFFLLHS